MRRRRPRDQPGQQGEKQLGGRLDDVQERTRLPRSPAERGGPSRFRLNSVGVLDQVQRTLG